jgi:excisionase family DNA binding protein
MTTKSEHDKPAWLASISGAPRLAFVPAEAAQCVGISRTRIFEELKAGRLRARRIGKATIISAADLLAWFETLPTSETVPAAPGRGGRKKRQRPTEATA